MTSDRQQREERRERIRKKKRQRLMIIAAMALIVILLVVGISAIVRAVRRAGREPMVQIGPAMPTEDDVISSLPIVYDYSQPIPASEAVGEAAFNGALFVGDARLGGFAQFGIMTQAKFLSSGSVSVDKAMEMDFDGETLRSVLTTGEYHTIYLSLGLNELGWQDSGTFIDYYESLLDQIRDLQPDAAMCVQLVVPVSAEQSADHAYINNGRIEQYNALIRQMAIEREVYFCDASLAMCDTSGNLLAANTTDGVHFSFAGIEAWFEYFCTHYIA